MFGQNREEMRQYFLQVWQKHQQEQNLDALETIVKNIILQHPEYQDQLVESAVDKDYLPEAGQTNPFLHMGLHIALHEQISTDRPAGIRGLYQAARLTGQSEHEIEHQMMECLAEAIWSAQRNNTAPDEQAYFRALQALFR